MSTLRRALQKFSAARRYSVLSSANQYLSTENEVKSPIQDVEIPKVPVDELVFQNAKNWGHKTALECGETKRKITYDQLRKRMDNCNKALRKQFKLQCGDVVAIMMPNVPEYPIVILGALKAGCVVTPINPMYTIDEVTRQLKDSNAKIIVTLGMFTENCKQAMANLKRNLPILAVKMQDNEALQAGIINFQELVDTEFEIEDFKGYSSDSLAFLPYSSGTTGLPKGVELTNNNINANITQCTCKEVDMLKEAIGDFQEVTPAILPMFHIYGTESLLWFLKFGVKTVTLPRFTPELYADAMINHKPTALFIVPPIVIYLNVYPGVTKQHLESVKFVNSGAAPLGALDIDKLKKKAEKDIQVLQGYGLSESPVVTFTPPNAIVPAGSVGFPVPNTIVKVVAVDDDKESPLPPNKTGELYVKGPQVMRGYFNNPEATKEAFSNGWFKTGDMVYYNEDNRFFVTDRIKELIKVKGFQVAPAELEEIIRDYPGVADACVIGVPHQYFGEVPRAYVVPKNDENINADNLADFVATKVSSYKKLDGGVAIIDAIPKNASGKLLRRKLKEEYLYENQ